MSKKKGKKPVYDGIVRKVGEMTPCCGYHDTTAVFYNPLNDCVQCHNCGTPYLPAGPTGPASGAPRPGPAPDENAPASPVDGPYTAPGGAPRPPAPGPETAHHRAVNGGVEEAEKEEKARVSAIRRDRSGKYGHPKHNMESIALMLQGMLQNHWQMPVPPIHPRIVPLISAMIKLNRSCHQGKYEPDTHTDLHVYVDISDELDERIVR